MDQVSQLIRHHLQHTTSLWAGREPSTPNRHRAIRSPVGRAGIHSDGALPPGDVCPKPTPNRWRCLTSRRIRRAIFEVFQLLGKFSDAAFRDLDGLSLLAQLRLSRRRHTGGDLLERQRQPAEFIRQPERCLPVHVASAVAYKVRGDLPVQDRDVRYPTGWPVWVPAVDQHPSVPGCGKNTCTYAQSAALSNTSSHPTG